MPTFPTTDTANIYQLQRTGNTESYPTSPNYTGVKVCVSPTGTDIQTSYGDVASYQLFEIFVYDLTLSLKNGDKIVTGAGVVFLIDGEPYVINNKYLHYIRVLARMVV